MAHGFIEPREERAQIWDAHAEANLTRAGEADKLNMPIGFKIAADCREAAKRAKAFSENYRK
jgi:hypothetical protein